MPSTRPGQGGGASGLPSLSLPSSTASCCFNEQPCAVLVEGKSSPPAPPPLLGGALGGRKGSSPTSRHLDIALLPSATAPPTPPKIWGWALPVTLLCQSMGVPEHFGKCEGGRWRQMKFENL